MLSLATFGAGFVTRPIGALIIGAYADRVGRRAAMMLCFVMIGCSLSPWPDPDLRQDRPSGAHPGGGRSHGAGLLPGGEIGAKHRLPHRGRAGREPRSDRLLAGVSQQMALVGGGLVGTVLTLLLPASALDSYGWRIAFLLGAVAVPFGLCLRSNLPETCICRRPNLSRRWSARRGWPRREPIGGSSSWAWWFSGPARSAATPSPIWSPMLRRRCTWPRARASSPRRLAMCSAYPPCCWVGGCPIAMAGGRSTCGAIWPSWS